MSVAPVLYQRFSGHSPRSLSQFINSVWLWFQIHSVFYNASQGGNGLVKQEGSLVYMVHVGLTLGCWIRNEE